MSSKNKGSSFERLICRQLSVWWSGNEETEDLFWRSSSSGGRATVRGRKGKTTTGHHGDITCTSEVGQPLTDLLVIEVKRGYNRATLFDLLDKSSGAAAQQYEKWIKQAEEGVKQAGAFSWLLIHKRDRRKTMVYFPASFGNLIKDREDGIVFSQEAENWIDCLTLQQFFGLVEPSLIRSFAEKHKKGIL